MAGIGFALERLYRSSSIADRVVSFAHASVIAAGPCLLAVLCIWLISAMLSELEGKTTIAAFRALIIYSFALSFVITAPIALVSARVISDKLHDRNVVAVPGIMLAGFVLTAIVSILAGTALFTLALNLGDATIIAAVADCALIALVWVACLFCSVTRDYVSVTAFFAVGMLLALAGVTVGYNARPDLATMVWGFNVGIGATLFGLLTRIWATFPFAVRTMWPPARALARALIIYWPIALGGLFGAMGAWIDKWIVWLSPFGVQIQNGLLHAPLYDSAMFVSYLVVIPAYAAFVLHLEVKFFRNYRLFYTSILEHGTLAQIQGHGRRLRDETIASLSSITVPQLVICALVALSAPIVVDLLDMQYRQVGTLRLGLIGAAFQFLFITCSSLALYFDRQALFLMLQTLYLVLNGVLTYAFLPLGATYLGLGFLIASAISALVAYLALARTLHRLGYLTFIANNPAVRLRTRLLKGV
ncbi:MAG: exopolysaccharide Pel transporter PelG [Xanthobacteraceae bacterium]